MITLRKIYDFIMCKNAEEHGIVLPIPVIGPIFQFLVFIPILFLMNVYDDTVNYHIPAFKKWVISKRN